MTKKLQTTTAGFAAVAVAGAVALSLLEAEAPRPGGATPDYSVTKVYVPRASQPSAGDWTMWGGTPHRNMVSAEKNPPIDWDTGDKEDPADNKNIKWEAALGSKAYGNPVVINGKVFVGTNNEGKRDPKYVNPDGSAIDGGVLMCFDEQSGKFLWQVYYSKLPSGRVNDWPG